MTLAAEQADPEPTRLERSRGFMTRLNAAADPAVAITEGLYVRSARGAGARIAASALAPSSHLLIGGAGWAKTTELLEAQRQLSRMERPLALYIDVSKQHDIGSGPGGGRRTGRHRPPRQAQGRGRGLR